MRPWLEFSPTDATKLSVLVDGNKEEGEFKPGHGEEARNISVESQDPDVLRSIAEEAYHRQQYDRAIPAFEKLADTGDNRYNDVAKLHHGKSLWRHGYYGNGETPKDQRLKTIKKAVELLREASTHVDARYSAQAWYEMSKAYHKLWKLTGDGYFDEAYKAAEEAAKLDYQMAYITWIERLDDEKVKAT